MQYMFDDFKNIRTFPAGVRAHRDGVLIPELSADGLAGEPLHIIHIGRLTGVHNWFIDMNDAQNVFLTARVETFGDTRINIEINPNLPDLSFDGKLIIKNTGNLVLNITGNNNRSGTKIKSETKLFAAAGSGNRLSGLANIPAETLDAETDIGFAVSADPRVKLIEISPAQRISSVPGSASHSASLWRPAVSAIRYLETAGLADSEAAELLHRAFMEEI